MLELVSFASFCTRNTGYTRSRTTDRRTGSSGTAAPCSLETGPLAQEKAPGRVECAFVAGDLKAAFSLERFPSALHPFLPASLPPQPSSGVPKDPLMKHNSPQGPQPTGVAIFGQFPVLWPLLSGEQILGLDLPGEWVLGLHLPLGGSLPLPFSSSSLTAVNISRKWKRKKKDKSKRQNTIMWPFQNCMSLSKL